MDYIHNSQLKDMKDMKNMKNIKDMRQAAGFQAT